MGAAGGAPISLIIDDRRPLFRAGFRIVFNPVPVAWGPQPPPVLTTALKAIFGSRNDRLLKEYRRTVATINALEPALAKLSDAELQAKTP